MRVTRVSKSSATMKSAPFSLKASTAAVAPFPSPCLQDFAPFAGGEIGVLFDPERANSFSMIFCVRMNQLCSPDCRMRLRVESVSKPGRQGASIRSPCASNHMDEGPGRMRMPWFGQIGSQFCTPFAVVPHAVFVDEPCPGVALCDGVHLAVDVVGHAADHVARRGAEPVNGPVLRRTRSWLAPMPPVVRMTAIGGAVRSRR